MKSSNKTKAKPSMEVEEDNLVIVLVGLSECD